MKRVWKLVGALQPTILMSLLFVPFGLYQYQQSHCGWLSVWMP